LVGNGKSSLRGSIFTWDALSGHELAEFPKASVGDLFDLAFSPDGRLLASGGVQSDINVWDFAGRTVAFRLEGHQGHVNSLAFSPDGRRLISGGDDGTIRFWEMVQGHFLGMARDTNGAIRSVVWGPGTGVIISTTGNDVTFWKPEPPVPATVIETGQEFGRTAISGHWLVTTRATSWSEDYADEESADVWDLASHEFRFHLIHHNGQPTAPVFSPDGRLFAFGGEDTNRVIGIWETKRWDDVHASLQPDHWWTNDFEVGCIAFSPDNTIMAAAGVSYTPEYPSGATNRLALFQVGSWRKLRLLEEASAGLAENAASVAFSNDGRLLAVGSRDGQTRLWDFEHQRLLWNRKLAGRSAGYGVGVTFSADNRWLASFSVGGTGVVLYDLKSPEQPPRELPKAEHSSLWCARFDPESRSLVASGNDGQIRFWDLETFKVELTLQHSPGGPHVCFCFAPSGNLLASMDAHGTVKLWEAAPRIVSASR
jgi:WD40 repeat protein